MHIPDYAHAMIRSALPNVPTSRQVGALDCCLCDEPFDDHRPPVPLGPTPTSGLFGCHPCLTRLVTRARRTRDAARSQDAEQAQAESSAWTPVRKHHLARLDSVRQAAETVAELARGGDIKALRVAWLLVSLESAHTWVPETPEPPASRDSQDSELKDEAFRLDLAMITAREAVSERLAYHLINEAQPEEPEMCEEFECAEDCSGRHDSSHIDCGPDAVFEDLAHHGIVLAQPEPAPFSSRLTTLSERAGADVKRSSLQEIGGWAHSILERFNIDPDNTAVLLNAAAVGLVEDAWREGPLDDIHSSDEGPCDGEIFAQSVDLYRRARAALVAAEEDGPEVLLAFVAIASNTDLRWAGGSRFSLRMTSESLAEFVQHVDDRVWFTTELMRQHGWRTGLLHRAASATVKAPNHFGMPGWPGTVASVIEHLAGLDRSGAPEVLTDLGAVEVALLEAPDRLGATALDWISRQGLLP
ncbi:hypothetical protein ABZ349_27885 [Streptomyces niveus]|uniref:hypothetical protein n=1 Tax=Streptomyces niveus TaxID=193462 RepID=UPI00340DFDDC